MLAQNTVRLEGKVLDSTTGEPVIGASVLVKGTTNGTVSDIDGFFSFSVPEGSLVEFSSIGYDSFEMKASKDESGLTVSLKPSAEFLDDVVVVAYGSVKKANLTGAVDQVSEETFRGRPSANATQMLLGAIPNLNINVENGKPGQSADYNIRGTTSIGSGGSALVLIDGAEGDPALLNPNDIESVSVLKDAASAAIYGSRATFGVVLITTKNPENTKEKFSLTYNGNFSVLQPTNIPDIIDDGYVYSRVFYEAYLNYNKTTPTGINKSQPFSVSWMDDFRLRKLDGNPRQTAIETDGSYVYYGNTNYYDVLYKKAVFAHSHNLSASGTVGRLSYYLSGRIYDYKGLFNFNPDVYRTFNIRGKASMKLFSWLTITENMSYDYDSYHIPSSWSSEGKGNFWRSINDEGHPSSALFNPDGSMTASTAYAIGGLITGDNYENRVVKTFKSTTGLKSSFFKDTFRVNADFSFLERDKNESTKRTAVPYSTRFGETLYLGNPYEDDTFQEYDSIQHYIATNLYAEYENTFAAKHWFKALAGWNYEERTNKGVTVKRNGLLTTEVDALNLAIGDTMSSSSTGTKWRIAGVFVRLNYGYDERYLFEFNGRYDGSSKFPVNSQWGFFPSGSAAWRISKEHWWKVNPNIVSNLKLRGSFGELGNGNVSAYAYMERFSFSNSGRLLDGERQRRYTGIPSQIPDNLTWETARTLDVGLDVGFLRGRLDITADFYRRWTLNMYTQGPTLPDTYGASTPKGNYADLHTDGFELSV
ncbi:MAG: SusC/RagA family TonB-linked outer membrane protein, partial [Bacteroidales bacterium]|nr:SusC/RagA family TonB-linked outer membrane protein [Bacteroidales bacterium]